MYTLSRLLSFTKLHLLFYQSLFHVLCHCLKYCSPHPLLLSTFSIPSSSLLSLYVHCVCVCVCVYLCAFCFGASVSPCWQRGITAPGIASSSQAVGWRSTSQMKRMLVHLKVAAEVPVDVFAVTLSVIFNPGWRGFVQYECGFYFFCRLWFLVCWFFF